MYHHVKNPLVKKVNFVKNVTYEVLSRLRRDVSYQCVQLRRSDLVLSFRLCLVIHSWI